MPQWNPGDDIDPVNLPDADETPPIGSPGTLTPFSVTATRGVAVAPAVVPGAVDLAFAPASYLSSLLSLAFRYARAPGTTVGPNASALAIRLLQPMDKLVQAAFADRATARVHQSRIAVEVLRRALDNSTLTPAQFAGSVAEEVVQVTASGETGTDVAGNLNDGDSSTKWTLSATSGFAQFKLGHPAVVVSYRVQVGSDATADPRNWQLQGSADGSTWTTLDTQTGQTFTARLQARNFALTNSNAYQFYRINVTLNNGGAAIQLTNWFLFIADSGPTLPAAQEQSFRGMAYDALLRSLGTSYTELRAARTAGSRDRKALADRLGLELSSNRPDRLDLVTVSPEDITESQLEQTFGYRTTQPTDPMTVPPLIPELLAGLRAGLHTVWRRGDEAERDLPGQPNPVIDPDLVGAVNLRGTTTDDSAFALWSARKALVDGEAATITGQLTANGGTLAGFDRAVQDQLPGPDLDFPTLAKNDEAGEDITPDLGTCGLTLPAFRFLVGVRAVYPGSTPLVSELRDIASIVVQARKIVLRYGTWRAEERAAGLVLTPSQFAGDPVGAPVVPPPWRGNPSASDTWRATLEARTRQADALEAHYQTVIDSAESTVLPALRDALLGAIGAPLGLTGDLAADRLTRELSIDLRASSSLFTDRVTQAINTMQSLLVSVRSGVFANFPDALARLSIPANVNNYDVEWSWLANQPQWLAAMRTFAYPENQLQPTLFKADGPLTTTASFRNWIANEIVPVRRLNAAQARTKAANYLANLRTELGTTVPAALTLTDVRTSTDLVTHASFQDSLVAGSVTNEAGVAQFVREIYWLVPMVLARKLQESRHYSPALDWYRTVFNYQAPQASRKIYRGLTLEMSIATSYTQAADWLATVNLNPHLIARTRQGTYSRATVRSIVECVLAFADTEFAHGTSEGNARAQALYQTAVDLLAMPEAAPPTTPASPFPPNPVPAALRGAAAAGLSKISAGLNISGSARPGALLPSQYRYAALIERAKALVATAQQVETAYFAALERADTENYNLLQAGHDLQVTSTTVTINDVKVAGAGIGVQLATVQQQKAQDVSVEMQRRIDAGLNEYEQSQIDHLHKAMDRQVAAAVLGAAGAVASGFAQGGPLGAIGGLFGGASQVASMLAQREQEFAQIDGLQAGYERRKEDWQLQRNQADRDVQISGQQIALAQNQQELAVLERNVAQLNQDHAEAVMNFLANKFTNAELHEWMSSVLGRVYDFFLQQATGMAQLAQAQLAFERQEAPAGIIATDYWQDATADASGVGDNQGLTGSARLLQDMTQLDQQAFITDRRRLELTHTFSLAQVAAFELEQFRQTGVLVFATPEGLFDREFPGHYLRLIKRVQLSVIALVPSVRGVRATLTASGMSRTVVRGTDSPGATFDTVVLRRDPEKIAFTSSTNANGLFALDPVVPGMLLPFEGMGVDAVWQLELPKAANPFDYDSIADVQFTIEYTALHNDDYRRDVIHRLGRRFTGDRGLSVRNQFPDVWYALNNPDLVEDAAQRMRATLTVTADDLPPHVEDLSVRELSLFVLWKDPSTTNELTVTSVTHAGTATGSAMSTRAIISTRRDSGANWQSLTGPRADPTGDWQYQLPDTDTVRSWFTDGVIQDLVVVMGLSGRTPEWR